MVALILLIGGIYLWYKGQFRFGSIQTEGRHVKVAGVLLMLPAAGAFVLSLLIGLFFGSIMQLVVSLLVVISVIEFMSVFLVLWLAYLLLVNPARAPRLPGYLGEVQAGIGPQQSQSRQRPTQQAQPAVHQTEKKVLTLAEAAHYLGMTEAQVLNLIDNSQLAAARSNNYNYQIARSQLDEVLQQRESA